MFIADFKINKLVIVVRLLVVFFVGASTALAMKPGFTCSGEERYQEASPENGKEQTRGIADEEDLSSLVQRDYSSHTFPKEIASRENTSPDPIMNVSASHESVAPLITLEQCQEAISKYPNAGNLVIQENTSGAPSTVAPPTFYDHFINVLPPVFRGKEKGHDQEIAQKSCQMTKELLSLLQQQYGEKIAAVSFPSAEHRMAIAHPLNTKDLDAILTTAEVLAKQDDDFSALATDSQIQILAQEAQVAEAKVNQTARSLQKKNSLLDRDNKIAHQAPAPYKKIGTTAFQLASLKAAEVAAHQKAIAVKDRLALAVRNAFQKNDADLSSDEPLSEGTPLLSRNKNGQQYHSIN